jgi:hypothetical protein
VIKELQQVQFGYQIKENKMANPLGIVARLTRPLRDTASDYFEKFDSIMKSGNMENILSRFPV